MLMPSFKFCSMTQNIIEILFAVTKKSPVWLVHFIVK